MTTQPTGIKFYWIGLKIVKPEGDSIFLKGPFNTQQGRDGELQKNAPLWQGSGVEFKPFETIGKVKADALEMAQNVLNISDTPSEIEKDSFTGATPQVSPIEVEEATFNRISDPRTPISANVPREIISNTPDVNTNDADNIFGSAPGLVEIAQDERERAIGNNEDPNASLETNIVEESLVDSASSFREEVREDLEDEFSNQFQKELREEGNFGG